MLDNKKLAHTVINPINTIKNSPTVNVSETFSNTMLDGDVSNFILNSNLDNQNLIK